MDGYSFFAENEHFPLNNFKEINPRQGGIQRA